MVFSSLLEYAAVGYISKRLKMNNKNKTKTIKWVQFLIFIFNTVKLYKYFLK